MTRELADEGGVKYPLKQSVTDIGIVTMPAGATALLDGIISSTDAPIRHASWNPVRQCDAEIDGEARSNKSGWETGSNRYYSEWITRTTSL